MYSFEFNVLCTHPSLSGHFPDNEIVPGVVIIDEIIRGILDKEKKRKIHKVLAIKFHKPLKPGVIVQVKIVEKDLETLSFTCETDDILIVKGMLRIAEARKS